MSERRAESAEYFRGSMTIGGPGGGAVPWTDETPKIENPIGINLMLMSADGFMQRLFLPWPPKGRYGFGPETPVWLEASRGNWMARATGGAGFVDADGRLRECVRLYGQRLLPLSDGERQYILYAEEARRESNSYHNYIALTGVPVQIGRIEENDIVYSSGMVSRHHAELLFDGRYWNIRDTDSANGVFVNGRRIREQRLKAGDEICIMGLRMIAGCGFLSVNDGNDRVTLSPEKLRRVSETCRVPGNGLRSGNVRAPLFNRFPRRRLALEEKKIEIEAPPMALGNDKIPLLLRMGSSAVMGGTAALSGNAAMLATSLFLPVISSQYTKEDREEYEKKRQKKYRKYLDEKWQEIQEEKIGEEQVLQSNYPPLSTVLSYTSKREKLWERRKTDDDFLVLRIGSGRIPMKAEIAYAQRRFELERDALLEEMYEMAERTVYLENAPILLDLKQDPVWGVLGGRGTVLNFVRDMIMRLTLLYSYDEVKLVLLADPEEQKQLEFVRYLPHCWDNRHDMRFLASDASEAYRIGDFIGKSLGEDLNKPQALPEMMKKRPYYVVFALDKKLFDSMEVLKTAIQQDKNCGLSVLAVFSDLPKECTLLLQLKDRTQGGKQEHTVVYLRQPDRADSHFVSDSIDGAQAEQSMRELADARLKQVSMAYSLPKTLTFLEMLGAGRIEHLDIAKRWQENNPVHSLGVPIGVGTDGSVFTLDLHQKFQGPHGLVAGTTGSGKSEFLLTYILSLALNFHPDEVAFVLIDYKGGGLAGAFEDPANGIHLPHLVGTITNLDGSAIARSLISIQSEMTRRQRVFNEAKSAVGEGTMDIYVYQRLYRSHRVKEPMPHLFIISDEFAELKQQQPEFLDQLVSIARIGRSLGVHLILATQKPSGVVTDQIVSNTKFRVCLKVQDRSDSMDMLKRPEAAELRETGRFYLQVGNNEQFSLGQSAYSGAEYEPQDEVVVKRDESIHVIDRIGSSLLEIKPQKKKQTTGKSQLVAIVRELTDLAEEMKIPRRSLWLEPLPKKIDAAWLESRSEADKNRGQSGIRFCCGMLDDPASQAQYPLTLDLVKTRNFLVTGEPGSGKTTFIQTMLYSLASRYTPEQVQFYILDYSSRLLRLFAKLPHCGAVLGEEQGEQLNAFFQLLMGIVQERKQLFTQLEADGFEAACRVRQIPLILAVIDNYAGLNMSKAGQAQMERMQSYIKSCANYGIRFIISISHLNEAPSRIKQELDGRIVLHMKDKYDYGEALGCRVAYIPPDLPGRGLYRYEERTLEMHLAMLDPDLDNQTRTEKLKQDIGVLCEKYSGAGAAKRLQVISATETYEHFCEGFLAGRIPLGYSLKEGRPVALPLKQFSMLSLYFGNPDSAQPVLNNFLYAAEREEAGVLFVKRREGSLCDELFRGKKFFEFATDAEGAEAVSQILMAKIQERNALLNEICREHNLDPKKKDIYLDVFPYMREQVKPVFVVFERYADLCALSREKDGLLRIFSSIYLLARRSQIYLLGCFYPDEQPLLTGNKLYDCFNPEKLIMLYGGSLAKQRLIQAPYSAESADKPSAWNRCVMHYRGEFHSVQTPCGERKEKLLPEDDRPIFG